MLLRQLSEVFLVKDLLLRSRAVPEADLARTLLRLQKMRQVSAQRSHARAPADIDHLPLRGFDMEIPERSDGRNDISRLQAEHVAGTNPGSTILAGRGPGNTHIEAQQTIRPLIAC